MVATINPYGAISEKLIAFVVAHKNGKFYAIDKCSSVMEIEKTVYENLIMKGVENRELNIKRIRTY